MDFEEYLRKATGLGYSNFKFEAFEDDDGEVTFSIYPADTGGARHYFMAKGCEVLQTLDLAEAGERLFSPNVAL
jgi:hypothetical protein